MVHRSLNWDLGTNQEKMKIVIIDTNLCISTYLTKFMSMVFVQRRDIFHYEFKIYKLAKFL